MDAVNTINSLGVNEPVCLIQKQSEYPECDKLAAVSENSQIIGQFLEWLQEDYTICTYAGWEYRQADIKIDDLMVKYFNIDLKKVEEERRQMLKKANEVNEAIQAQALSDKIVTLTGEAMKIHISFEDNDFIRGESVWAIKLNNKWARINSVPFFSEEVGYEDIVEYGWETSTLAEFKKVIVKKTKSWGVKWTPTFEKETEWSTIKTHLRYEELHFESVIAGMLVIALPSDKTDEENWKRLKAICYSCPIELTPFNGNKPNDKNKVDKSSTVS